MTGITKVSPARKGQRDRATTGLASSRRPSSALLPVPFAHHLPQHLAGKPEIMVTLYGSVNRGGVYPRSLCLRRPISRGGYLPPAEPEKKGSGGKETRHPHCAHVQHARSR